MNIFEIYYTAVANSYDTDFDGAKEIIAKFIKDLKKEIDESDDEEVKILWNEEFGGEEHPDVEDFLGAIFMFGHNPFIPKKKWEENILSLKFTKNFKWQDVFILNIDFNDIFAYANAI